MHSIKQTQKIKEFKTLSISTMPFYTILCSPNLYKKSSKTAQSAMSTRRSAQTAKSAEWFMSRSAKKTSREQTVLCVLRSVRSEPLQWPDTHFARSQIYLERKYITIQWSVREIMSNVRLIKINILKNVPNRIEIQGNICVLLIVLRISVKVLNFVFHQREKMSFITHLLFQISILFLVVNDYNLILNYNC